MIAYGPFLTFKVTENSYSAKKEKNLYFNNATAMFSLYYLNRKSQIFITSHDIYIKRNSLDFTSPSILVSSRGFHIDCHLYNML